MKAAIYPGSFDPVTYGHLDIIRRAAEIFDELTVFEYELQIAQTNRKFSRGDLDTMFLTTSLEYAYLSSSTVREFASFNGDVSQCVPEHVAKLIYEKYGHNR